MDLELIPWSEQDRPSERVLKLRLADEGFQVFSWRDAPGADYQPHAHDCDETLWVVDGEIVFGVEGREYRLRPGDRLMLPRGTTHTARAGKDGAAYLIGQRS
jgi:quercetin dioxygenase-like cupin family protein